MDQKINIIEKIYEFPEFVDYWKSLNQLEEVDMREVYEVYFHLDETLEAICLTNQNP